METLIVCPACESAEKPARWDSITDFSVSGERFVVVCCPACGLRYTNPRPDKSQIGPYYRSDAYVSHTGADAPGIINVWYRRVRNYTLGVKRKQVRKWSPNEARTLLDVGCGTGEFAAFMQKTGWSARGVEPDPETAERARRLHGLKVEDEAWLEETRERFSVITLWHVLEHVHDLRQRVERIHSLLTPGGLLVVAVPNPESTDARHYGLEWAAWDVPRHLYHFPPSMLRSFIQRRGFVCLATRPMYFDPMYVSMLSEKYRSGSGAAPLRGLIKGLWFLFTALLQKDACSSQVYFFRKEG